MNRKEKRVKIKNIARVQLAGNWLKGGVLIAFSLLFGMFCTQFVPLYAPAQPIDVQKIAELNSLQMFELLADMLVPEVITRRHIARMGISIAIFMLVIPPFEQGLKQYFSKVFVGDKPKLSVAFSWYTNLAKVFGAIRLYIYIGILSALWAILILIVPAAAIAFSTITGSVEIYLIGTFAFFIGMLLLSIKLMAYMPAYYIYAKKPSIGVVSAVRNSVYITKGRLVECFVFRISFILWEIAAILTGSVGKIFFMPYYITSNAGFVELLIAEARAKESNAKEN